MIIFSQVEYINEKVLQNIVKGDASDGYLRVNFVRLGKWKRRFYMNAWIMLVQNSFVIIFPTTHLMLFELRVVTF